MDIRTELSNTLAGKIFVDVSRANEGSEVLLVSENDDIPAFVIGSDMAVCRSGSATHSMLPAFTLVGVGKTQNEAIRSIVEQENRITLSLLFTAAQAVNTPSMIQSDTDQSANPLKDALEQIQYQVERHRLIVSKLFLSAYFEDAITKLITTELGETAPATLWGMEINYFPVDLVSYPMVVAVSEGKYLGGRVIRSITESSTYEGEHTIVVKESLALLNSRAVSCGATSPYIQTSLNMAKVLNAKDFLERRVQAIEVTEGDVPSEDYRRYWHSLRTERGYGPKDGFGPQGDVSMVGAQVRPVDKGDSDEKNEETFDAINVVFNRIKISLEEMKELIIDELRKFDRRHKKDGV